MPTSAGTSSIRTRNEQVVQLILSDIFSHTAPSSTPRAVLLASVQSVGRRGALQRIRHHFSQIGEPPAQLSLDRLHLYASPKPSTEVVSSSYPRFDGDMSEMFVALVDEGIRRQVNLAVDLSDLPPPVADTVATRLRDAGYRAGAMVVATSEDQDRQASALYLDLDRSDAPPGQTLRSDFDRSHARIRALLQTLAARQLIDQLQVVTPQGQQLYATEADPVTGQVNERAAVYALEDFARRAALPREIAQSALRWQTLAQRLSAQQQMSRDLVAQVIAWRNEAVRKAEADPEAARWLSWGRAAEAFRVMDPQQLQREFPEHSKLVERLQDAERYALEHFPHLEDRARFLSQTRARLAERIAEGRSPMTKPSPTKPPRTR